MGRDIYIENAEGVHLEGNTTGSGRPIDVEMSNSSGVIRDQHTNLKLTDGSEIDIVDSDISHLVVDESVVQLYDVLVSGVSLSGSDDEVRTPQQFTGGKLFDTTGPTSAETAIQLADNASQLLEYLQKIQFIVWLSENVLEGV